MVIPMLHMGGYAGTDCNDENPQLNPQDQDGDGFSGCTGDCDDSDPLMYPSDFDNDGYSLRWRL